jgi:flagellar biosynthesis/type III secretory pathway protein FliH
MNTAKRANEFTEKGESAAYVAGYEDAFEDAAVIAASIAAAAANADAEIKRLRAVLARLVRPEAK